MDSDQVTQKQFDTFFKEWRKKDNTPGKQFVDQLHDVGTYMGAEVAKALKDEHAAKLKAEEDERRKRQTELDDYHQKLERSTAGVIGAFKMLEGRAEHMSGAFSGLLRMVVPGAIGLAFTEVFEYGQHLTKTYRSLVDVGQTFSGSIVEMSKAAADSGLTMTQYAEMISKNPELQKSMQSTGKDLTKLAKTVRSNSEQFGMFGMSVDEMNEVSTEYAKRQRSFGLTSSLSEKEMAEGATSLASEVSAAAGLFGKSRKQIMEDSSTAMKDAGFLGMMQMRTGDQFKEANKRIQSAITDFAGLPGQMGKELPDMLAKGMATGTTAFTSQANMFVKAGVGGMMNIMNQAAADAMDTSKDSDQVLLEANNKMVQEYQRALPQLTTMANHGNAEARQVIEMMQGTREMKMDEFKKAREDASKQDAVTKELLLQDQKWVSTMADIRRKLVPFMQLLLGAITGISNALMICIQAINGAVNLFVHPIETVSSLFKGLADKTTTVSGLFGSAVGSLGTLIGGFAGAGVALIGMLAAIKIFKSGIATVVKSGLASVFDKIGLGNTFRNLFKGKDFTIKANHVTVIGAGGGSGHDRGVPFLEGSDKDKGAHHEHEKDMNRKKGMFGRSMDRIRGHRGKLSAMMVGLLGMGTISETLLGGIGSVFGGSRKSSISNDEAKDASHAEKSSSSITMLDSLRSKAPSAGSAEEGGSFMSKIAKKFGFLGKFLGPLGKAAGFLLRATGIFGKLQLFIGGIKIASGIIDVVQGKKSMGDFLWESFKTIIDGLLQAVLGPIDLILEALGFKSLSDRLEEAIGLKKKDADATDPTKSPGGMDATNPFMPTGPKDQKMIALENEQDETKKAIIQYQKDHPNEMGTDDMIKKLGDIEERIREQTLIGARQNNDLIDQTKKNRDGSST